jgi:hypothetical protein
MGGMNSFSFSNTVTLLRNNLSGAAETLPKPHIMGGMNSFSFSNTVTLLRNNLSGAAETLPKPHIMGGGRTIKNFIYCVLYSDSSLKFL